MHTPTIQIKMPFKVLCDLSLSNIISFSQVIVLTFSGIECIAINSLIIFQFFFSFCLSVSFCLSLSLYIYIFCLFCFVFFASGTSLHPYSPVSLSSWLILLCFRCKFTHPFLSRSPGIDSCWYEALLKQFCYDYLSVGKGRKKIHVEHDLIWNILFWVSELEIIFYWSARPGHKNIFIPNIKYFYLKLSITANQ